MQGMYMYKVNAGLILKHLTFECSSVFLLLFFCYLMRIINLFPNFHVFFYEVLYNFLNLLIDIYKVFI